MIRDYLPKQRPMKFIAACLIGILFCALYPTDLASYRTGDKPPLPAWVEVTDTQLRFINTIAQIGLPLLMQDKAGMIQLAYVAVTTTIATHGLKWILDDVAIAGTRLGERPYSPDSRHNMPSGHSSMASCAAYFVARRYGLWHALYLIPIMLLTMSARVMLDAHTISAVLTGCLIGLICAAWWTSPYQPRTPIGESK
jgi:lipid A 1-phosphatase